MNVAQARIRRPGAGGLNHSLMDLLQKEPAETYHAQAASYLSSHQLALFRECPLHYRKRQLGRSVDGDRPAYVVGRAAHSLILEGREAYDSEFAVGGPINPKTNAPFGPNTKAFAEWAAKLGKTVLTADQSDLVEQMSDSVRAHPLAAEFISNGMPEGVIRCDYQEVPCQVRLDWLSPDYGIVDLKTTDNLKWFEADARRFGYIYQLAFYRAVTCQVAGDNLPVHLVAVEKREPYRCGVWLVSSDALTAAEQENEAAIERLRKCRDIDEWPTGYETLRLFDGS